MKLISLKIDKADTCGGLLDGLRVVFRGARADVTKFDPLCLIGPNGSGKSQLLQVIAEIFQLLFFRFAPEEERGTPNDDLTFEIEYLIPALNDRSEEVKHVRAFARAEGKRRKPHIGMEVRGESGWTSVEGEVASRLLPSKVVGYTSGDNETLSLPFFSSRAGYAEQVRSNAISVEKRGRRIPDPRMLLIDYGTNLEVLVANLLLNPEQVRRKLLEAPNLKRLRSFRCVVQLNHPAAKGKNGVKLTQELENYVAYLKRCATCYDFNQKQKSYTFDFFVAQATHDAFTHYWPDGALDLYSCFHKLAMLNDLIIPKKAREVFDAGIKERRFAARLPEPFDEHKVFRFESVSFDSSESGEPVAYVALSDGEHQLAQLLGTACMASFSNVLFLLDEPESHFNPRWRVEFIKTLRDLPTQHGVRSLETEVAQQECLITTHSPFVPSDMQRENVLIFSRKGLQKIDVRRPEIQTFGSKFDAILAECFGIFPPISALPRDRVDKLLKSGDVEQIEAAISELGESTARMQLAAKLSELEGGE